jgi:hypothetical protein
MPQYKYIRLAIHWLSSSALVGVIVRSGNESTNVAEIVHEEILISEW